MTWLLLELGFILIQSVTFLAFSFSPLSHSVFSQLSYLTGASFRSLNSVDMASFQNPQSYLVTQTRYLATGLPVYPSQEAHQNELEWDRLDQSFSHLLSCSTAELLTSERLSHLTERFLEEKRLWQRGSSAEPPAALETILLDIYKVGGKSQNDLS